MGSSPKGESRLCIFGRIGKTYRQNKRAPFVCTQILPELYEGRPFAGTTKKSLHSSGILICVHFYHIISSRIFAIFHPSARHVGRVIPGSVLRGKAGGVASEYRFPRIRNPLFRVPRASHSYKAPGDSTSGHVPSDHAPGDPSKPCSYKINARSSGYQATADVFKGWGHFRFRPLSRLDADRSHPWRDSPAQDPGERGPRRERRSSPTRSPPPSVPAPFSLSDPCDRRDSPVCLVLFRSGPSPLCGRESSGEPPSMREPGRRGHRRERRSSPTRSPPPSVPNPSPFSTPAHPAAPSAVPSSLSKRPGRGTLRMGTVPIRPPRRCGPDTGASISPTPDPRRLGRRQ